MTDLKQSIQINVTDPESVQRGVQALADHITTLHEDVGALTQLLAASLFAIDMPTTERGVALRIHDFASDEILASTRVSQLLRNLIERYPSPPDGGSHLRVVVSNEPIQAKAA